jgi:hypothetical protein
MDTNEYESIRRMKLRDGARASARFNTRIGEVLTNFQPDSCKPLKRRERRAPIVLFDLYAFVSIRG